MNRLLIILPLVLFVLSCKEKREITETLKIQPAIFPDYKGITVPNNIAPLNFKVNGEYTAVAAEFVGKTNEILIVEGEEYIDIPVKKWSELLKQSEGDSLKVTVFTKKGHEWIQYAPFYINVSVFPIDKVLMYRRIAPGYEVFSHMGIYQRDLSAFDESPLVENTLFTGSCMNCHSFSQNDPSTMMFHIRGKVGGTMLYSKGKDLIKLNTKTEHTIGKFQYPYWHPSKKYVAYTVNKTSQTFHSSDRNRIEVFDFESDVIVYDLEKNTILVSDKLKTDEGFETWPAFSPEGDYLYFATAPAQKMPVDYKLVKYSLCRIGFDSETGTFDDRIDTLINASVSGKSIAFPRISPDGRYLMITQFDYGNFPIWHREADLYLYDLKTGEYRDMIEVNSFETESYHTWSSNGRWFVFSSRRVNGLYTMPFIAFFDEAGNAGKPFLLPQKNPDYYDQSLYSFNVPELVNGFVDLDISDLETAVYGEGKDVSYTQTD